MVPLTLCGIRGDEGIPVMGRAGEEGVNRGKTCLLIRKHDHFTPTREIKRHVCHIRAIHAIPDHWYAQLENRVPDGGIYGANCGACIRIALPGSRSRGN